MMNRKIRILHFELDRNPGGIESFLLNMYSRIDRERFQFDFVTRYDNAARSEELKALGAKVYKVHSFRHPIRYYHDIKMVLSKEYDIVHIHKNSAANIIPIYAAKSVKGVKIIVHSHNTSPSVGGLSNILHRLNRKKLWKLSDEHVACSEVAGKWLYGNNKGFKIIRNGIETDKFAYNELLCKKVRKELSIPVDAFVCGHVGRFTEQKNHEYLLKIFSEIWKKNKNSYLLLIGGGPLEDKMKSIVKTENISNVKFLGLRSDVNKVMQCVDCFIMPSLYEGLPIVAIEAQAAGCKVYLADTISKQTKITDSVEWFSLNDALDDVANRIIKSGKIYDRAYENEIVKNAGYDAKEAAINLEEIYLKMYSRRSNK